MPPDTEDRKQIIEEVTKEVKKIGDDFWAHLEATVNRCVDDKTQAAAIMGGMKTDVGFASLIAFISAEKLVVRATLSEFDERIKKLEGK